MNRDYLKYKSSLTDFNELRNLVVERLYPEIFEILNDIDGEKNFIDIQIDGWTKLQLRADEKLYFWSHGQNSWEYEGEIKINYCPIFDKYATTPENRWNSIKYVEFLHKELNFLKKERNTHKDLLSKNIMAIKKLSGVATRKVLIEKI